MDNKRVSGETNMTAEQALQHLHKLCWNLPANDEHAAHELIDFLRQALSAPRVPDIGGHVMNECAWAFVEAMPDGECRRTALTSTWLKPALHKAMLTASPEPVAKTEKPNRDDSYLDVVDVDNLGDGETLVLYLSNGTAATYVPEPVAKTDSGSWEEETHS